MSSVGDLVADLSALGVGAGDVLMVHASLRRVGCRADDVIDAIDAALGPDGTWLMVLGAACDGLPFDALTTPAEADVGVLAEVFRRRPGTCVSDHPEGRFGARGRDAAAFVAHVPWHDYYGAGSPLERLVARAGHVLRMGASPDTTTLIHYAEQLVPLPNKRRVRRERDVRTAHGIERRVVETLDDSDGIVDWPGDEDYFATILGAWLATGRARTGRVGGAACELIAARDLVPFAVAWMTERFTPILAR